MTDYGATTQTLGVDIGGANIKLADANGNSLATAFPMWTDHSQLSARFADLLAEFHRTYSSNFMYLAVTMTGEMADCFATRSAGVDSILEHVARVVATEKTYIYSVQGDWLTPTEARHAPWMVAASNWHALATWSAARFDLPHDRLQLVLDIGSTTTDIVPLREGKVASLALTDRQRMECGQLVYTGIGRTAVAAILQQVEFESGWCPLVAETFATSDDAYLVLRLSPEVPSDQATADGRPRTIRCAGARLARMIGEDLDRLAWRDIERLAEAVIDRQAVQIAEAITRNFDDLNELPASPRILVSGHGRALAQRVLPRLPFPVNSIWLDTLVSPSAARCAPAHAVAWLLSNYLKSE